jgi:hypothetical protein
MITYLEQLEDAANGAGIPLREAVIGAGVPDSNYYRWVNGKTTPNVRTVIRVLDYIDSLAKKATP